MTKELFKRNFIAFKQLFNYTPKLFIYNFLYQLLIVLIPYTTIYFSSKIISEITTTKNVDIIITNVCLTLSITLIMGLLSSICYRKKEVYATGLISNTTFHRWMGDIYSDLDYPDLTSKRTQKLSEEQMLHANFGYGLHEIFSNYEVILKNFFKFIIGLFLCISLFTSNSTNELLNSWYINLGVIVLLFLISAIAPTFTYIFEKRMLSYSQKISDVNKSFGYLYYEITSSLKNACDIRLFKQDKIIEENLELSNSFSKVYVKFFMKQSWLLSIKRGIEGLLFTGIALFVCYKAYHNAFGIAEVTLYISSMLLVFSGFNSLTSSLINLRNNGEYLKPSIELMNMKNKMYIGSLTTEKRTDNKFDLEFKNVSFKYPDSDTYVLKDVSVKFEVGKKIAIVGENGSGKTTFIKLLTRLYDPTEGTILLNGIDIKKYKYDEYMQIFSVVFQDFGLLSSSIASNIASSENYDINKVNDCISKVGLDERVSEMDNGINTTLFKDVDSNGVDLSGGEQQKVAIARALYKDSPFVILDEPTASLDPISEYEIYSHFKDMVQDKTALYISHRLSSCVFCDNILVFENGSIIETGNHKELLKNNDNKYSLLWNSQAQFYAK